MSIRDRLKSFDESRVPFYGRLSARGTDRIFGIAYALEDALTKLVKHIGPCSPSGKPCWEWTDDPKMWCPRCNARLLVEGIEPPRKGVSS